MNEAYNSMFIGLGILVWSVLRLAEGKRPEVLRYYLFTEEFFHIYFTERNLLNLSCLKLVVSKVLGYGIIVGAMILKVPQILKILSKKSVFGLSFASICFEILTNVLTATYSAHRGNPFSTYGETVLIMLQMIIVAVLFIRYSDSTRKTVMGVSLSLICASALCTLVPGLVPPVIFENALTVQMILFILSRGTQIVEIHRCKSTGSLAFLSCFLAVLGNIGRVFTAVVETPDDIKSQMSYGLALLLNGYILLTFLLFRKALKTQ